MRTASTTREPAPAATAPTPALNRTGAGAHRRPDGVGHQALRAFLGDVELGTLSDSALTELRRSRVGFVFQGFNLIPTLTALENVTLPLALAGRKPEEAWLAKVVSTVGLESRLGHRPSELSGGQQQRVAVARALVSRPEVVFADEPTGNLDSRSGGEILAFMRAATDETGQTVVMVTHDPVAASYSDQVVFLADGRIVGRPRPLSGCWTA